ncbi:acetyl-coenzyme A synthetase isoform X2 [Lepeophtheirus salmonis]
MSDVYKPIPRISDESHCHNLETYQLMYDESINNPISFWGKIASQYHWKKSPSSDEFLKYNFDVNMGPIFVKWMADGVTNICYNAIDRHLPKRANQIAFYWEGNNPEDTGKITYKELHMEVCKFSNVLKSKGVQKGDRVAIYMPMIIELVVAMLACARIGAVHSIVFGGYSSDSLASRIVDGGAKVLISADGVYRGNKLINLLDVAYKAMEETSSNYNHDIDIHILVSHIPRLSSGSPLETPSRWKTERDHWWHEVMEPASIDCDVEWMNSEDPLFLLYTSGSTGKPKGVLHTTAGYMIYAATTFKYVFDYQDESDVYWCTADIGWITGHTYVTYGPLLNGSKSVLFEGTPFYPTNDRFWEIIQKYSVSKFYTAPTAIRALMKFGEDFVSKYDLSSLKVLGTVGEPINPEAWFWYHKNVGGSQCSIVDTYWQTETGGHIMTPLPGCTPTKPGSACFPFFGVLPVILDESGKVLSGEAEGYIVFNKPWPGMMRSVYGNHDRFEKTYFSRFPGYYMSGDGAKRDKDGYIWITGRIDDMLNCSGHLMSTAQVESALVEHRHVAEAAVVSTPHPIKGECLYCFITPMADISLNDKMVKELKNLVREKIAPFAQPDFIQEAPNLPKTRSGKIMRRILRKIAQDDDDVGDISTMADPDVVKILQEMRKKMLNPNN